MKEKVTISVKPENIAIAKYYAKSNNKTVSDLVDEFFESIKRRKLISKKRKKSEWISKSGGIFESGSPDIMKELFGK